MSKEGVHDEESSPTYDTKVNGQIDSDLDRSVSQASVASVGREQLSSTIPPHESYEGRHRWDPSATWTPEEEARIVRKTDIRLLTWICLMFLGLQLDRGNLSNALTDNFLVDLKMSSNDYNNGSTIQLLAFLVCEFPVQFLTKRYGFKNILPTMMMLWGTVSWAQAFITNRAGFYVTRAFLGACEGGFIPGTILFATYFYTSRELSVRLSAFWATLNIARIISALLAAAILNMRGVQGKPGWFWLFIIEGLLTFLVGFISYFYLPQSPIRTKGGLWVKPWYTEREEVIMINRLLRDDPAKGLTALKEPATLKDIRETLKDSSMWGLYFIGLVAYIPATPITGYMNLTLKRLGFSTFDSNMLGIPAAVLQIILMLALSYSSERAQERTFHCIAGEFWILPLLAALLALPAGGYNWGRYTVTTMISGYPYFHPIVSAWISENSFSVKKRAITAATYNVIVQIGSVVGSQIYRADDSPYYYRGNKVCIAICVLSIVAFVVQRQYLVLLNNRKDRAWEAMSLEERLDYQMDTEARERDGNKRLDFRFQI